MISIRSRLLLLFLGLMFVAWAVIIASTYVQTSHEVEEIYDAHLVQSADELLMFASHEYSEQLATSHHVGAPTLLPFEVQELVRRQSGDEYAPRLGFRVWVAGRILLHSTDAPLAPPRETAGFSEREDERGLWRVYTRHSDNGFAVEVAEHYGIRSKIVREVALATAIPALFAFPIIALLAWFSVGRGLAPLSQLARQVSYRAPESLAPVSVECAPREVLPLVEALNRFLERLSGTLERERRFAADASHELRTPLASLKVQAQVAARAADAETRARALGHITEGVDRATHLVEQLMTLARLDPAQVDASRARIDLNRVSGDVLAQLAPEALSKSIELDLTEAEVGEMQGRADLIAILMRNLVDNAVRYTPQGGRIVVRVRDYDHEVCLEIDDSGPGIPNTELDRVFDRFYRGLGHGQPGCGLGLSIVQRIAELHRAAITLGESPLGGLRVAVRFHR
ncbi:MAG: ATP-binding protein [Gammaproteobacteria bacterium]|nr:ATP-binding protein [Gammaproteobacteria bacterium]